MPVTGSGDLEIAVTAVSPCPRRQQQTDGEETHFCQIHDARACRHFFGDERAEFEWDVLTNWKPVVLSLYQHLLIPIVRGMAAFYTH